MKTVLLTALFCIQLSLLFAQETVSAIELVQLNILYRNYDNPIKVAISNSDDCKVVVTGQNCAIRKDKEKGHYTVRPGNAKMVSITVNSYRADSLVYSKTSEYRVSNIPDAMIFFGAAKTGSKVSASARRLQALYPPEIPLRSEFNVISWELYRENEFIARGMGEIISEASDYLDTLKEPTNLLFAVTVQGPDGITRKMTANFLVEPSE